MVRQIQVTVPLDKADAVMEKLLESKHSHYLARYDGKRSTLITMNTTDTRAGAVLHMLGELGIGIDFGFVNVLSVTTCTPRLVEISREFSRLTVGKDKAHKISVERLPLEEIYEMVLAQNRLSFDYLAMCATASVIASVGLMTDNIIVLVASMLLSPLMGPILGLTFAVIIKDEKLRRKSMRNEVVGVVITWLVGALVAVFTMGIELDKFPTEEMESRGNASGLVSGLTIAIPSGVGVALAVTSGTLNPLVGVAISASILPPATLSGLSLVFAIARAARGEANRKLFRISAVSLVLWLINVLAIFGVALLVFRFKELEAAKSAVDGKKSDKWKELNDVPRVKKRKEASEDTDDSDSDTDSFHAGAIVPASSFAARSGFTRLGKSRSTEWHYRSQPRLREMDLEAAREAIESGDDSDGQNESA